MRHSHQETEQYSGQSSEGEAGEDANERQSEVIRQRAVNRHAVELHADGGRRRKIDRRYAARANPKLHASTKAKMVSAGKARSPIRAAVLRIFFMLVPQSPTPAVASLSSLRRE